MKKNNNKKITMVISAMLVSIIAIGMLAGCSSKPTPVEPVEPVSSVPVSSEVVSSETSSEPVSEPSSAVESDVSSEVSSEVSSVASVEPVSDSVSSEPVKETTTPPKTVAPKVESKPVEKPKPSIPVVDELPSNPSEGDSVIMDNTYWDYEGGKWWQGGRVTVVDDSDKTYPPCDTCGQPQGQCTCRVGY